MRLQFEDFVALDPDRTGIGMGGAAEGVEQRGLAGAVRPDNRLDNTAGNLEVNMIQRDKPTEPLGDAACHEYRRLFHHARISRCWMREATDARPPGARTITTMTPRP